MKYFKYSLLFLIFVLMLLLCCCSAEKPNLDATDTEVISNYSKKNSTEAIQIEKYKYINCFSTFSSEFKDGYVIFTDTNYLPQEEYYGKVRWCDEAKQGIIVNASLIVASDKKEIYSKKLQIEDVRNQEGNNHTWDYIACYEPQIKVKCEKNSDVECYIKMTDSNNIEYHVMLIPIEEFNSDDYFGSAVYIIDKENGKEFWYDDLIKQV